MENKDQEKSFCQYFETFKQSIMKNAQKNNEIVMFTSIARVYQWDSREVSISSGKWSIIGEGILTINYSAKTKTHEFRLHNEDKKFNFNIWSYKITFPLKFGKASPGVFTFFHDENLKYGIDVGTERDGDSLLAYVSNLEKIYLSELNDAEVTIKRKESKEKSKKFPSFWCTKSSYAASNQCEVTETQPCSFSQAKKYEPKKDENFQMQQQSTQKELKSSSPRKKDKQSERTFDESRRSPFSKIRNPFRNKATSCENLSDSSSPFSSKESLSMKDRIRNLLKSEKLSASESSFKTAVTVYAPVDYFKKRGTKELLNSKRKSISNQDISLNQIVPSHQSSSIIHRAGSISKLFKPRRQVKTPHRAETKTVAKSSKIREKSRESKILNQPTLQTQVSKPKNLMETRRKLEEILKELDEYVENEEELNLKKSFTSMNITQKNNFKDVASSCDSLTGTARTTVEKLLKNTDILKAKQAIPEQLTSEASSSSNIGSQSIITSSDITQQQRVKKSLPNFYMTQHEATLEDATSSTPTQSRKVERFKKASELTPESNEALYQTTYIEAPTNPSKESIFDRQKFPFDQSPSHQKQS